MKLRGFMMALVLLAAAVTARAEAPTLDIYWVDVEGGAATLIVTPAKESILIDTGWPGGTSAARIHDAAKKAGIARIDYLILTHFHIDHFGGAADLAQLMPIGVVLDNGIPNHNPDKGGNDAWFRNLIRSYRTFKAERRKIIEPGQTLPLRQTDGTAQLSLTCMGARGLAWHGDHDPTNALSNTGVEHPLDTTDNRNSVISLLRFGPFKFFDGGDLTWNYEKALVCPTNSIGTVDVFQVDHHGINLSSNPVLLRSLSPTVSVMDNGPRKGDSLETMATLRATPSIRTMYQLHKDLRGGKPYNTADWFIANLQEKCDGNYIKCSVDPSGKSYTISIPATGFSEHYETARH